MHMSDDSVSDVVTPILVQIDYSGCRLVSTPFIEQSVCSYRNVLLLLLLLFCFLFCFFVFCCCFFFFFVVFFCVYVCVLFIL